MIIPSNKNPKCYLIQKGHLDGISYVLYNILHVIMFISAILQSFYPALDRMRYVDINQNNESKIYNQGWFQKHQQGGLQILFNNFWSKTFGFKKSLVQNVLVKKNL